MRKKYLKSILRQFKRGNYFWFVRNSAKFVLVLLSAYFREALTGPVLVAITPSWQCNARCVMCDYPERADKKKELSTAEIERIIDELKDLNTTEITFYGGEPLLRQDIFHLIDYASRKGIIVHMPTNGILLSDMDFAKKLINSGIDTIAVSLDATTKEGYKKIRNVDGFERTIWGIKNLVKLKETAKYPPDITIISTITKHNIDYAPELIKLAKSLGVDGISIFPAQAVETKQNKFDEDYKSRLKEMLIYLIKERKSGNEIIDDSLDYLNYTLKRLDSKVKRAKCFAPYTDLLIDPFGNIYPCVAFLGLNKPFANIRDKSIRKVWFSKEMQEYRNKLEKCEACEYMCHIEFGIPFNRFWIGK